MASGTPWPSQIRWRLLPNLARSVGLGPVCAPQKPRALSYRQLLPATNQSARSAPASPATRSGSVATHQPPASHANAAQQVIPEPQPSSCGSISHGIPLRRTNKIPVRQARSGKRGLPPLGFAFGTGMKGSTNSHNLSGKSSAPIGQSSWEKDVLAAHVGCRENEGFVRSNKGLPLHLLNRFSVATVP